ncbi:hydrophobe/amphiphile efflux-3 (HAE3) family transporter [Methanoregula sp.]|uniref:efflux RND transporter permease subunit n=1 Tax=Methanoregula sp. TaxID=2052170 RepID=UPI002371CE79|nr:hydrophobe/amphiphile efflux-3 (HAE3) family transporter [Methanoregula sp.]MDD1686771.1 hydrophobe/amphiphile efflux-3 (HAE3) family transporter [Methanoregula sp.]
MIKEIFEFIAHSIIKKPRLVACLVIALFCLGLYGMTSLSMATGWETYVFKDSPAGALEAKYNEDYKADTIILIVEAGDPLSPDVLAYVDNLETDIRQQQNIKSVQSLPDVLKAYNGGTLPTSEADTLKIVNALPESTRALLYPSNVLTLVQIKLTPGLSDKVQKSVLNNMQSVVDTSSPPPGVTVEMSGSPAFTKQMGEGLTSNMGILIGGALILMIITMGILFSYVRHRFMPVLLVALGLVTSLGLMGLAGISLNMAVIGAFPVLIGLGIDYAIQFHARFDEEARKGSLEDAVFMTVTRTGPAVMYAMLATSMGFLAMMVSTVPMIRSFGIVSIIGINTCFWISCIGMPTLALLVNYKPKPQQTGQCYAVGTNACDTIIDNPKNQAKNKKKSSFSYGEFLTSTSVKIAKNPIPVLLVAGLIALIGFQIDPTIPVSSDENSFVPSDMPAKINIDKVTRIIGATSTADLLIQGGRVTDLDTVIWIKEFQDYELAHHTEMTGATSIVTYILEYNGGVMPETQAQLDTVLASIPEDTRTSVLSDPMCGIIRFSTGDISMIQQNSLKEQVIKDIEFLEPPVGITVAPAGSFELYTSLLGAMSESKDTMTILGFIFVGIFLILVYRHLHAISPMIPIIFVVGWNAVMMYIIGLTYNPLTATLGSMTIGVAAEYTILVMERYAEEEERLHDPIAAIQESVQKIGSAITVSGLATFFGFSALCLATFPIISNFGISTLIAVAFSLIGAIFIMPAVLSLVGGLDEKLKARKKPAAGHGAETPADETTHSSEGSS